MKQLNKIGIISINHLIFANVYSISLNHLTQAFSNMKYRSNEGRKVKSGSEPS